MVIAEQKTASEFAATKKGFPVFAETVGCNRSMNSTVLKRPNLKILSLCAVLLALIGHVISSGFSQGSATGRTALGGVVTVAEMDLDQLLEVARAKPSSSIYTRISEMYAQRHDYRKALAYLRKAEKIAQSEDAGE